MHCETARLPTCSFIEQQPIFFNACNINNNTLKKNITDVLQNVANELTTQYQCKQWNDFVTTGITNCNNWQHYKYTL